MKVVLSHLRRLHRLCRRAARRSQLARRRRHRGVEARADRPALGVVFTVELLANRGDHYAYAGIAREVHARAGGALRLPSPKSLPQVTSGRARVTAGGAACLAYSLTPLTVKSGTGKLPAEVSAVVQAAELGSSCPSSTSRTSSTSSWASLSMPSTPPRSSATCPCASPAPARWLGCSPPKSRRRSPKGRSSSRTRRSPGHRRRHRVRRLGHDGRESGGAPRSGDVQPGPRSQGQPSPRRRRRRQRRDFIRGGDPTLAAVGATRAIEILVAAGIVAAPEELEDGGHVLRAGAHLDARRGLHESLPSAPSCRGSGSIERLGAHGFSCAGSGDELLVTVPPHRRWDVEEIADVHELAKSVGYGALKVSVPVAVRGASPSAAEALADPSTRSSWATAFTRSSPAASTAEARSPSSSFRKATRCCRMSSDQRARPRLHAAEQRCRSCARDRWRQPRRSSLGRARLRVDSYLSPQSER